MSSSESESNEIQYMILLSNNLDKLHSFQNEEKEKVLYTLYEFISSMMEIEKTSINTDEISSISYFFNKFIPVIIRILLKDPVFKHTHRSKETIISIFKILITDLSKSIHQLASFSYINHSQHSQNTQKSSNLSLFPQYYESISEIFDYEKTFFRSDTDCFDLFFNHSLEYLYSDTRLTQWKDCLSEGEVIDCLYIDKSKTLYKTDVGAWERGMIIEINRIDQYIKVIFDYNKEIRLYNLSSNQIFPSGTFTKNDFTWREELKENDEIDVLDFKSWYKCTVIERKGKKIKYAQRVYTEKGKLKDMNGRNYIGYSEISDKEICVFDYRLRKAGEFSKEIINYEAFTYYPNDMKEFNEVETILPFHKPDLDLESIESTYTYTDTYSSYTDKYIYIIPRKTDKNIDICLLNLMNFFIKSDSLKNILLALSSLSSYENFNLFSKIINFLSTFFHRTFSKLYCKAFADESMKYMITISNMERRNFNRSKIENSIRRLREILMKSLFENDVNWIFEKFTLEFGVISIESKILDVKILGMRMIITSIESMLINKYSQSQSQSHSQSLYFDSHKHLPIEFIYDRINQSQVLKKIFKANDTHFEIIHLAGELIKILSMKKLLSNDDIKYLYILSKESMEKDIVKEVYSIIKSNCHFFGNEQLVFMIDLIIKRLSQDKDMTENDINLVITLYNLITGTSTKQAFTILSFFLDLILSSYELRKKETVIEQSILFKIESEFMVILSSWDMREHFQSYINRICMVITSNNQNQTEEDKDLKYDLFEVYSFLFRLLNKLYNKILNSISQGQLLNYIFNSCDLYSKFIQILSEYHTKARISLLKKDSSQEEVEKSLHPQLTYLSHCQVIERIVKTFDFFFKNRFDLSPTSEINVHFLLFKYLVKERVSSKDCYYYVILVNDYIKSLRNKDYLMNNEKEFVFLFSSLLDELSSFNFGNEFSHNEISVIEDSVWNMFYWMNRLSISQLDDVFNSNSNSNKYNGISNTGEVIYSCENQQTPQSRLKRTGKDLIMLIKYNKDQSIESNLQSIHSLWSIIINLTSTDSVLVHRLINLYTNNSFTSEVKTYLWESFIKTCVSFLSLSKKDVKKIKMTLNLLTLLIEESEVYGTAGVNPHGKETFSEGSMLVLNYYVHISSRYDKDSSIKVSSSLTFWELKSILSQRLNIQPCLLEVQPQSNNSQSLTNKDNSKTLHDLRIKNDDMLFVSLNKDILNSIPKASLMIDYEMNPVFLKVLNEIFDTFRRKDKEIMEFNEVKSFFEAINSYNTYNIDDKIKTFIVNNGNGEYLSREDFISFYYNSIVNLNKTTVVWDNLTDLGYRNDLQSLSSPIERLVFSKEHMPRHVISAKNEYFDTIYSLEDEIDNDNEKEDVSYIIKKFLDVIATNQSIYSQILLIKQNDYEKLLSFQNKHINYILSIIYSICHDIILSSNLTSSLQNDVSFLSKVEWIERFAFSDGVSFLLNLIFECDLKKRKLQKISLLSLKSLRLIVIFDLKYKLNQGMISEVYSKEETLTMISSINQFFLFENCSFSELYSEESEAEKTISLFIKRMIDESSKLESDENGSIEKLISIRQKTSNDSRKGVFIEYNHLFTCLIEYILRIKEKEFITYDEKNIVSYSISIMFGLLMTNIVNLKEMSKENQSNLSIILSDILIPYKQTSLNRLTINKPTILRDLKFISVVLVLNRNSYIVDFLLNELIIKTLQKEDDVTSKGNSIVYFLLEIMINLFFLPQTRRFLQSRESIMKAFVLLKRKYSHEQLKYVSEEELYGLLRIYYRVLYLFNTSEEEERNDLVYVTSLLSVDFICSVVLYISNHIILNSIYDEDSSLSLYIKRLSTVEIIYDFLSEFLDMTHVEFSPIDFLLSNTRLKTILSYLSLSNTVNNLNNDYISSYNPFNDKKKKYVGLKNPSSICYINSIIQQLYHVPSFKYSILLCKDNKPINNKQVNDILIDDNLLHQTQKLFTYLDMSIKQDTSILDFCYSFKDYDNNPTDIRIQQDSQEFLSRYLDKIEECMKNTEYKSIVKSLFIGKVCSQMICTGGCGTVKNTYEDFPYLSLEIKLMTKLQESLQSLNSEERIEYTCEVCKQKVDLIKKTSIYSLPHVLFIHLKRFDYNYQTFQIDKLNSRLDFPLEINLKEYSITDTNDYKENYYDYRLVGVNIHIGTASAGHYKSIVLSREDENWYLINDSHISNYDIKNLEYDCFGGVVSNSNEEYCHYKEMRENSQNAYMLVYERKSLDCEYTTVSRLSNNENDIETNTDTNNINTDNIRNTSILLKEDNKEEIKYFFYKSILNQVKDISKIYNPYYLSIINDENIKFLNDRMVLNEYFIYFFDSLVRNCSSNQSFIQIFSIFFDVIIKSHFKSNTNQILIRLSEKLTTLLIHDESLYETLLTQVIFKSSKRKDFILNEVLLSNEYNSIYSIFIILLTTGFNKDFAYQDKNCLLLLESILNIMSTSKSNEIFKYSHRLCFIGYFKLLREISELDSIQYKSLFDYLFNNEIIYKITDFILNIDSLLKSSSTTASKSSNTVCPSNIFTALANFVLLAYPIITNSNHHLMFELNSKGISYRYHLSNKDIEALENKLLYIKSLSLSSSSSSFSKMISHCMWNNIDFTKKKLFTILDFLNDGYDPSLIKNGLDLLNFILDIKDEYQLIRLEWILGIPEVNIKYLNSYATLPNSGKSKYEKVVKFTSPLLYNTNNESLLSLITKKYQSLGDYLHIINYFICIILRNSHSLFLNYLLNMPHPYLLTHNKGLIEYIYLECENEIKRISKLYTNTQQQVITDYQKLKIRLDELISEVESSKDKEENAYIINKSYSNMNFSITLNEYSIIKETIHDITPFDIVSKGLEIKVLRVLYTLNRSVNLIEKSKNDHNNDDFNEYTLYNDNKNSSSDENEEDLVGKRNKTKKNQNNSDNIWNYHIRNNNESNEDNLYSQIINKMNKSLLNEYIREYDNVIIDNKYIEDNIYNSFIRYIVINTSNSRKIKVSLQFTCESTTNNIHIYLPHSNFTYEIEPNSISNIHSFISSNITPIDYESIRLTFSEDIFLDTNIPQLPSTPNKNELSFDNWNFNDNNNNGNNNGETFDIACTSCGYSNVINNYSNFECSNCSSPLFG